MFPPECTVITLEILDGGDTPAQNQHSLSDGTEEVVGTPQDIEHEWKCQAFDGVNILALPAMDPLRLTMLNSKRTAMFEEAERQFQQNFIKDLLSVDEDQLRNYNDRHYLMELRKKGKSGF